MVGFMATFAAGSPVTESGAFQLVLRAISGGMIFGVLGFVIGELMHRYISKELEREVEALLLQKELRRQEKLSKAREVAEVLGETGERGLNADLMSEEPAPTEGMPPVEETPAA